MPKSIQDELAKLPRTSWRGIVFPMSGLQTRWGHRLTPHQKPDRKGARVESSGMGPRMFTGQALFHTGIVFEGDVYKDPLYPTVFHAFRQACEDGSTGELVHPELGTLQCKFGNWSSSLMATTRDGVTVECEWTETLEEDSDVEGTPSPLAAAVQSAIDLDSQLVAAKLKQARLKAALDALDPKLSFEDSMRSIRSAADTASLLQRRVGAKFDMVQYQLDKTRESLDTLSDVTLCTVRNSVERLQAAVYAARISIAVTKEVALYTVPARMTLGALASALKTSVGDLLKLNRTYGGVPDVPAETVIRYYK